MAEKIQKNIQKGNHGLHVAVITQMLSLATSGFGLVAALAWNNVVQELVNNYIRKFLPNNSGIVSLTLYAVIVTIFAVLVTMQLSQLKNKLESHH